jgi:hypothetical protein
MAAPAAIFFCGIPKTSASRAHSMRRLIEGTVTGTISVSFDATHAW